MFHEKTDKLIEKLTKEGYSDYFGDIKCIHDDDEIGFIYFNKYYNNISNYLENIIDMKVSLIINSDILITDKFLFVHHYYYNMLKNNQMTINGI